MNLDNSTGCLGQGGQREMYASMKLAQYIELWLKTFKQDSVKPATLARLQTSLKALAKYSISEMRIQDITAFDIQNYVNQLTQNGYGLTTIKKQLGVVTSPLRQAAALHYIPADPSVGVKLPTPDKVLKPKREIAPYSTDEQEILWRHISFSRRRGAAVIGLMLETGLRVGEALALRWQYVDLKRRRLTVAATILNMADKKRSVLQESPKTISSRRTIPLTARAIELLTKLQQNAHSQWVFDDGHGSNLTYEALRYQTQILCEDAGIEYRGEHVFRHTFATNCYYRGIDVKVLSKILGHADVNVTYNIYISLRDDGFDEMDVALNG